MNINIFFLLADEVLNTELPFVKTRPLKNAIPKSRMKAQDYIAAPATRPKTCVSLARRLVSGHLGMKINVTDKQKEAERQLLSDARGMFYFLKSIGPCCFSGVFKNSVLRPAHSCVVCNTIATPHGLETACDQIEHVEINCDAHTNAARPCAGRTHVVCQYGTFFNRGF